MSVREWMNNNPAMVTIGAVLVLVICLVLIIVQLSGGGAAGGEREIYYYDLNTEKLFTASNRTNPPIETDSGAYEGEPAGVQATVFACGQCDQDYTGMTAAQVEQNDAAIGYLEKFTPEAKEVIEDESSDEEGYDVMLRGHLVRRVDQSQWVPRESEEGYRITQEAQMNADCPPDQPPQPCVPPQ